MNPKFMKLEQEKKERVINAALKEFAQKGFKSASTNRIVEEANISKGLLFHYFGSKKNLYIFVCDYAIETFLNDFYGKVNYEETDIIERWTQVATLKLQIIKKYPEMYRFMLTVAIEDDEEVKDYIDSLKNESLEEGYKKIFEGFDTTKFKKGIDVKLAIDIIIWTIQGFSDRELQKLRLNHNSDIDYDSIVSEYKRYNDQLKICFYK